MNPFRRRPGRLLIVLFTLFYLVATGAFSRRVRWPGLPSFPETVHPFVPTQAHWAYRPPIRPPLPPVRQRTWVRNAVDAFVLAKLEAEGLDPSPKADRPTLIRRLSLDLTGLPPGPAEVDAFLKDSSPDAYETVVDRLLASPHYGERLALHWLDLARFGDTTGLHVDRPQEMWFYRDWVIQAFNANKPFDVFTVEQLAGDLVPYATVEERIATGFHRNAAFDIELDDNEGLAHLVSDRVNTTGTVWLGSTLGCAACHDHKHDPFTQKDYYRLFAFFNGTPEFRVCDEHGNYEPCATRPTPQQATELNDLERQRIFLERKIDSMRRWAALGRGIPRVGSASTFDSLVAAELAKPTNRDAFDEELREIWAIDSGKRTKKQKLRLSNHYLEYVCPTTKSIFNDIHDKKDRLAATKRSAMKEIPSSMVLEEMDSPRNTFVLRGGDIRQRGQKVTAGVPDFLPPLPSGTKPDRLALARWLTRSDHPLTARVTVNRYWELFFGHGLVKTGDDFGTRGTPPSHPELLDWLAVQFVQSGWDVKGMLKLLVMSNTYRQSSRVTPELLRVDAENRLYARGPRFRLPAELIRDNALAIGGLLNPKRGGPSVFPYQPPGLWEAVNPANGMDEMLYVQSKGGDQYRRGLYVYWKRALPHPALVAFDAPSRVLCTASRPRTNTPLQALVLLNDPCFVECARALGQRALAEGGTDSPARLGYAFRLCTARAPTARELDILQSLYRERLAAYRRDPIAAEELVGVGAHPRPADVDTAELAAWTAVGNALLNLDETITKE